MLNQHIQPPPTPPPPPRAPLPCPPDSTTPSRFSPLPFSSCPLSVASCPSRPAISYVFGLPVPSLRKFPRTHLTSLPPSSPSPPKSSPSLNVGSQVLTPTLLKSRLARSCQQHPGNSTEQAAGVNLNGRDGHERVRWRNAASVSPRSLLTSIDLFAT